MQIEINGLLFQNSRTANKCTDAVFLNLCITFPQIADGGDLEPQMFGLTTKFHKMQEATINNETPAIGNVLL